MNYFDIDIRPFEKRKREKRPCRFDDSTSDITQNTDVQREPCRYSITMYSGAVSYSLFFGQDMEAW